MIQSTINGSEFNYKDPVPTDTETTDTETSDSETSETSTTETRSETPTLSIPAPSLFLVMLSFAGIVYLRRKKCEN